MLPDAGKMLSVGPKERDAYLSKTAQRMQEMWYLKRDDFDFCPNPLSFLLCQWVYNYIYVSNIVKTRPIQYIQYIYKINVISQLIDPSFQFNNQLILIES